jgi:hypothetical protein
MPYLTGPRREAFALARNTLKTTRIDGIGELVYLFCYMADIYVGQHITNFELLNSVVGAFESAKAEYIRNMLVPYEQNKQSTNGDVWKGAEDK